MTVNADWHERNPMPKNATDEQRLAWHREHAQTCGCRQPPDVAAELARRDAAAAEHQSGR